MQATLEFVEVFARKFAGFCRSILVTAKDRIFQPSGCATKKKKVTTVTISRRISMNSLWISMNIYCSWDFLWVAKQPVMPVELIRIPSCCDQVAGPSFHGGEPQGISGLALDGYLKASFLCSESVCVCVCVLFNVMCIYIYYIIYIIIYTHTLARCRCFSPRYGRLAMFLAASSKFMGLCNYFQDCM